MHKLPSHLILIFLILSLLLGGFFSYGLIVSNEILHSEIIKI